MARTGEGNVLSGRKLWKLTETSQLICRMIPQTTEVHREPWNVGFSCIHSASVPLFYNVDQLIMCLVPRWLCNLILCHKYNGLFVFPRMHPGLRIRHLFHSSCFEEISSGYIFILPIKTEASLGQRYPRSVLGVDLTLVHYHRKWNRNIIKLHFNLITEGPWIIGYS